MSSSSCEGMRGLDKKDVIGPMGIGDSFREVKKSVAISMLEKALWVDFFRTLGLLKVDSGTSSSSVMVVRFFRM